ncbi:26257_t:CDS:2 [Dentiscutata erythropus]|uniref:26257_t:CDS:1 n=1 Tax=Dentiscutata erythropus TaxID=1348616 RepID=A0A9N9FT31_9GLOM|nr:26257_t:CDS:2 [Dentiscutata erythropus]
MFDTKNKFYSKIIHLISIKINKCSSCAHYYPPENFIYKGKTYKTCAKCLISKAEKRIKLEKNNVKTTPIETILSQVLCDYVAKLILNIEGDNEILFKIHINLYDDIFLMANFDDLKSIVRIIIDKIEEDLQPLSNMAQSGMIQSGMIQSSMAQSSMTQSGTVQSSIVISVNDDGDSVNPDFY